MGNINFTFQYDVIIIIRYINKPIYQVILVFTPSHIGKEGRKEMFYLTMHSTHFIYGYMASDMVKNHSDSETGKPAAAT